LVRILESNVVWKKHIDQIIKTGDIGKNPDQELDVIEDKTI